MSVMGTGGYASGDFMEVGADREDWCTLGEFGAQVLLLLKGGEL